VSSNQPVASRPRTLALEDLSALAGQSVGVSPWATITQDQVTGFASLTGDDQWIHTDPVRAGAGPFAGTIGHGFMTLAQFTRMLYDMVSVVGAALVVNYGVNRVRFPAPVPVGSRIRGSIAIGAVEEVPGGVQVEYRYAVEVEGSAKPACVAEILFRYYRQLPGPAPRAEQARGASQ
jgi:acyl dehydratase